MQQKIIELCEQAARFNWKESVRKGNIIYLGPGGSVVVVGDIHGHVRNFHKSVKFADLQNNPDRHIILQEIIHGGPEDNLGGCLSYNLLFEAMQYKLQFPEQVHFVFGNHDTAVISNSDVMKAGKEMTQAMRSALQRRFETGFDDIDCAIKQFLLSQPLAVRCSNRIWISHSLPGNRYVEGFDISVLDKRLGISDMQRLSPVYNLTWGRRHSQHALNMMAKLLDVDVFLLGHQQQENGWALCGQNTIILASDHNHGCLIHFDAAVKYTIDELVKRIIPIASIE